MKLKTLLLGSAAAMIAVSGVRAADAIVAEPEPMDYVKVCDMYGAGFWYIPGTETCMRINGYVRTEYQYDTTNVAAGAPNLVNTVPGAPAPAGGLLLAATALGNLYQVPGTGARSSRGSWLYRVRMNVDTRNETDYGTLQAVARFQADGSGADGNVVIDRALISLGGLRAGYSDSYWTTAHGYGILGGENGGYYGFDQVMLLDYTVAANGFSGTAGIQMTNGSAIAGVNPDFYAGVTYSGSWGNVAGSYLYDNVTNNNAYKGSIQLNLIENLGIKGLYVGNDAGHYIARGGAGSTHHWSVSAQYAFLPNFNVFAGFSDSSVNNSNQIIVGAHWQPVPGLDVHPEVTFRENNTELYQFRIVRSF